MWGKRCSRWGRSGFLMLLIGITLTVAVGWIVFGRSPVAASSVPVAPAQYVLQGRVYEGNVGDEGSPLQGVTVSLYCSNNHAQQGTFLRSTTTDATGWYGLEARETCEYYNIIETDPAGYTSMGATTVDGNVIDYNWIEYTSPLEGKTLTGNKFWDERLATETPTPTPTSTSTPTPTPTSTGEAPSGADLEITKSGPTGPVSPGSLITYTVVITNYGPLDAPGVVVTDVLPAQVAYVSCTPSSGSCGRVASRPPNDVVRWEPEEGAAMPYGRTYTLLISARVDKDACGLIRNRAEGWSSVPDPNPGNNEPYLDTDVGPCGEAAISVRKRLVDPPSHIAKPGDIVTFEIEVVNTGSVALSPVSLTDTFDSHSLSYVSALPHPSQLAALPGQGIIRWVDLTAPPPFGFGQPLAPGSSFVVTVRLKAKQPGIGENCARATGQAGETQVRDGACDEVDIRDPEVDLQISKRLLLPSSGSAVVSDTVRFEIRLTNTGSDPIVDLRLRDTYDTNYLSFAGADYDPDDPTDDGALDWGNLTSSPPHGFGHVLLPGQTETFVVRFHAKAPTPPGQVALNCIRAWYRYGEEPEHETPRHCARVRIVGEAGPAIDVEKQLYLPHSGIAYPGDTIYFGFIISNTGTTTFTNVSLVDTYDTSCLSFVPTGWPPSWGLNPDDSIDDGQLNWSNYIADWPSSMMPPGGWQEVWPGVEFQAKAGAGCDPTINTLEALATDQQGAHASDIDHEPVRIVTTPGVTPTPTPTTTPTPTPTRVGGGYRLYFPLILRDYPLPLIFSDDFNDGNLAGWTPNRGTWLNPGDRMRGEYAAGNAWNMRSERGGDFIYEGTVNLRSGNAVGLTFRSSADGTSSYDVILDAVDGVFKISKRPPYQVLASYSMSVQRNHPYRIRVIARGNKIEAYLDGVKRLTAVDGTYRSGRFGVMLFRATATYDDLEARRLP